jgi:tryptophanyl-tRNA synthetase
MPKYFSGIQPSGKIHIGNYFGCIKPFVSANIQSEFGAKPKLFLIADMHCFTKSHELKFETKVNEIVRSLIASGINPEDTAIVQQSRVIFKFHILLLCLDSTTCKLSMVLILFDQVFTCGEYDSI